MTDITYIMGQLDFQLPKKNIQVQLDSSNGIKTHQGELHVHTLQPPINLNLRFYSRENCPFVPKTEEEERWLEKRLQALRFFNKSKSSTQQVRLHKNEIEYFKELNPDHPNAWLFIHGFNVPLGTYGKVISATSDPSHLFQTAEQVIYQPGHKPPQDNVRQDGVKLHYISEDATVYRDKHHIEVQFSDLAQQLNLSSDNLNGTGAHNWWLHMEHNLNQAAGFKGFQYQFDPNQPQYTRLINIAWVGDPKSTLDYIAMQPTADITGRAMVSLIEQLSDAGIAINIIAHSAGCIVLLKLMQYLAEKQRQAIIDHAFFWQAAMPNYALSPKAEQFDCHPQQFWHTQQAHQATKQLHVFYSLHDNVLGPIPAHQQKNKHLGDKYYTPDSGKMYASLALSIDVIDELFQDAGVPNAVASVYQLAHMFSVPTDALLFSPTLRQSIYQRWHDKDNINLQQDVVFIQKQHPALFNDLSLFIGLFVAIMQQHLVTFLNNPQNQPKIRAVIAQLDDDEVNKLETLLEQATKLNLPHHGDKPVYDMIVNAANKLPMLSWLAKAYEFYLSGGKDTSLIKLPAYLLQEALTGSITHRPPIVTGLLSAFHHPLKLFIKTLETVAFLDRKNIEKTLQDSLHDKLSSKISEPNNANKTNHATQAGNEMAALLITVFSTPGATPQPAMGYAGPLRQQKDSAMEALIQTNKVSLLDQTAWLMHHGAMKIPNKDMREKVYRDNIMLNHQIHFGRYQ